MTTMPAVSECSVDGCGYNHDGCHAFAITVAGNNGSADCGTFIPLARKGGLDKVVAQVGACQRTDCTFNKDLECSASDVRVGAGSGSAGANCLTYQPA
ncbi:DUF1540 domain-containing protein [Kineosporia rhizophila]|uniref:DUF1540 domain-containing protein n=1 Tax=Kineosporia TaxID=49184 RepID=UPI001E543F03|nr:MULTISPECIES: DUF1540 domain-containing protein [Kineosporia]MCE0534053.1 DUF1540 domain-containing protein [Kineosporia rhizophila]GLY13595.1 hypothetical protein Kisp01_06110 [Kineosporia sp. NBRC 101677]